tara:strand:+ start:70767 stop:71213 length:447 start_codon:yes stop_codon:yes gene_type:complete
MKILKTDSSNSDFIQLIALLDADLAIKDGDDHAFYDQFNKVNDIKHVLVAYANDTAIACGAIKEYDSDSVEIKRMFTDSDYRGKGAASEILQHLENWAKALGYKKCILETGIKQLEAIGLYPKNGYHRISNYGQYSGLKTSVCFAKVL